jgi:hypothetical protein
MRALPDIFLNLGKGILMLSLGLVLFNLVGYDSILKLITTMISLGIAFKLMAGGDDSWTSTAKLFIVIGIILATTNALLQTQNIKWDSVLKLPAFIGALGIALHIGGFDKFEKIKVMNMLSISLLLLTLSLLEFKYITWENIIKYNVFIAGLGLSLRTIKKDIPILSLLAMGFVVLGLALLDFQELNWMSMIQIIGVVGLLGVVINKFVLGKLGSSKSYNNMSDSLSGGGFKGGGLIGFAHYDYTANANNMIASESKWAEYKRVERKKDKEIGQCPKVSKKSPIEIDIELESEKWQKWNDQQIQKQIKTDRLENLNLASRDNQVLE